MPYLKWSDNAVRGVQKAYRFLAEKDREAAMAAARAIKNMPPYWPGFLKQADRLTIWTPSIGNCLSHSARLVTCWFMK